MCSISLPRGSSGQSCAKLRRNCPPHRSEGSSGRADDCEQFVFGALGPRQTCRGRGAAPRCACSASVRTRTCSPLDAANCKQPGVRAGAESCRQRRPHCHARGHLNHLARSCVVHSEPCDRAGSNKLVGPRAPHWQDFGVAASLCWVQSRWSHCEHCSGNVDLSF